MSNTQLQYLVSSFRIRPAITLSDTVGLRGLGVVRSAELAAMSYADIRNVLYTHLAKTMPISLLPFLNDGQLSLANIEITHSVTPHDVTSALGASGFNLGVNSSMSTNDQRFFTSLGVK